MTADLLQSPVLQSPLLQSPWAIVIRLAALLAILLLLQDAFEVMLLTRRVQRRMRFAVLYFRTVWFICSRLAMRVSAGRARAALLSQFGAISMLGLFVAWAAGLILAFGAVDWTLQGAHAASLADQLYMSGATFFTLGYGDVVPHSGAARIVSVMEAGIGLGFIALVIGYLPLIHQLFSRREALVIRLDGRAGSPPTALALLCRHAGTGDRGELGAFLREGEVWGTELLEGHLSYPMLAYYRSQHDNQSWLAALTAVTDCCALLLVGADGPLAFQARMTFAMMRQVAVEMARSFRIEPARYEGVDRLPPEAAERVDAAAAACGLEWPADEESRLTLQALRASYEPLISGLARFLLHELPGWVPEADAEDHWTRGHRGLLARTVIAHLSPEDAGADERGPAEWARIRERLK